MAKGEICNALQICLEYYEVLYKSLFIALYAYLIDTLAVQSRVILRVHVDLGWICDACATRQWKVFIWTDQLQPWALFLM